MDELYGVGAEQTYALGATIAFTLRDGDVDVEARGVVKKAFTPFSQSQVLLVDVSGTSTSDGVAILKIYDPRFLRVRKGDHPGRPDMPWSLEREIAAVERRATLPPRRWDDDPPSERESQPDSGRQSDSDASPSIIDPLDFEIKLFNVCDDLSHVESTCYSRLSPLQGKGVPLCYGVGVVHAVSPDPDTPRPISPACILMEYVDGDSLLTVDRQRITRAVARSLLETVHAFAGLGVIHADLHRGNVLFSPRTGESEKATRAVVIDFAQGAYRGEDQSDESWQDEVDCNWDFPWMCREFHKLGIRDEDPVPCDLDYGPKGAWNSWASKHPRWVEPCEEQWEGLDGVQLVEPIRWRLKPEVQDWVDDQNKQGALPLRPGSPLDESTAGE